MKIQTPRSIQPMKIIPESGLYKLLMRSDKPEAREFQHWVTSVVLPVIRKDGGEGLLEGLRRLTSGRLGSALPVLLAKP